MANELFNVMALSVVRPGLQYRFGYTDSIQQAIEMAKSSYKSPTWVESPYARATKTVYNVVQFGKVIPVKRN